jgi:hypothetical protein
MPKIQRQMEKRAGFGWCSKCQKWFESNLMVKNIKRKNGLGSKCLQCCCKHAKKKFEIYGDLRTSESRRKELLRRDYNMTPEDYSNLLVKQDFRCKICSRHQSECKSTFCVDHSHTTNKLRGLLCRDCNLMLGLFQDQISSIQAAIDYLTLETTRYIPLVDRSPSKRIPGLNRGERGRHYKCSYGITVDEYDKMLLSQDGKCAICNSDETNNGGKKHFSIDHDHITDTVRGLLCQTCNFALGRIKDNPNVLRSAIVYLESYSST